LIRILDTFSTNVPEITIGVGVPYAADVGEIEVIVEACFGSTIGATGTTTTGVDVDEVDGVGVAEAEGVGVGVGLADADGVGVADADADGDAEADGDGLGVADAVVIVKELDATDALPGPAMLFAITVTVHVPCGTEVKV
jgi:hypothetical protein